MKIKLEGQYMANDLGQQNSDLFIGVLQMIEMNTVGVLQLLNFRRNIFV